MTRPAGLAIAALALLLILLFALPWPDRKGAGPLSAEGPEKLASLAFEALGLGDFEPLGERISTGEDLAWAFKTYAREGSPQDALAPLAAVGGAEAYAVRLRRDAAESFDEARKEASFDWEGAKVVDWRTVDRASTPGGVPLTDIVFEVANGASERHFATLDCFETPRGWVSNAGVVYLGGGDGATSSWVRQRVARDQRRLRAALAAYRNRQGDHPETLRRLLEPSEEGERPLLYSLPQDPWGHDYYYESQQDRFNVWSTGPDGLPHTIDDVGGDR